MASSNGFWADLVLAEIDDKATAKSLIIGLDSCYGMFRQILTHWPSAKSSSRMDAEALSELKKTRKSIERLQEALEDEFFAKEGVRALLDRTTIRLAADYEEATGRKFGYQNPVDSLRRNLMFCELILAETIQNQRRGRGAPVDERRDFLVGLIEVAFREEAPFVPRTYETSSLFFKVVAQFESDLFGESENNLSRRIKRVLGKIH